MKDLKPAYVLSSLGVIFVVSVVFYLIVSRPEQEVEQRLQNTSVPAMGAGDVKELNEAGEAFQNTETMRNIARPPILDQSSRLSLAECLTRAKESIMLGDGPQVEVYRKMILAFGPDAFDSCLSHYRAQVEWLEAPPITSRSEWSSFLASVVAELDAGRAATTGLALLAHYWGTEQYKARLKEADADAAETFHSDTESFYLFFHAANYLSDEEVLRELAPTVETYFVDMLQPEAAPPTEGAFRVAQRVFQLLLKRPNLKERMRQVADKFISDTRTPSNLVTYLRDIYHFNQLQSIADLVTALSANDLSYAEDAVYKFLSERFATFPEIADIFNVLTNTFGSGYASNTISMVFWRLGQVQSSGMSPSTAFQGAVQEIVARRREARDFSDCFIIATAALNIARERALQFHMGFEDQLGVRDLPATSAESVKRLMLELAAAGSEDREGACKSFTVMSGLMLATVLSPRISDVLNVFQSELGKGPASKLSGGATHAIVLMELLVLCEQSLRDDTSWLAYESFVGEFARSGDRFFTQNGNPILSSVSQIPKICATIEKMSRSFTPQRSLSLSVLTAVNENLVARYITSVIELKASGYGTDKGMAQLDAWKAFSEQ